MPHRRIQETIMNHQGSSHPFFFLDIPIAVVDRNMDMDVSGRDMDVADRSLDSSSRTDLLPLKCQLLPTSARTSVTEVAPVSLDLKAEYSRDKRFFRRRALRNRVTSRRLVGNTIRFAAKPMKI